MKVFIILTIFQDSFHRQQGALLINISVSLAHRDSVIFHATFDAVHVVLPVFTTFLQTLRKKACANWLGLLRFAFVLFKNLEIKAKISFLTIARRLILVLIRSTIKITITPKNLRHEKNFLSKHLYVSASPPSDDRHFFLQEALHGFLIYINIYFTQTCDDLTFF